MDIILLSYLCCVYSCLVLNEAFKSYGTVVAESLRKKALRGVSRRNSNRHRRGDVVYRRDIQTYTGRHNQTERQRQGDR